MAQRRDGDLGLVIGDWMDRPDIVHYVWEGCGEKGAEPDIVHYVWVDCRAEKGQFLITEFDIIPSIGRATVRSIGLELANSPPPTA